MEIKRRKGDPIPILRRAILGLLGSGSDRGLRPQMCRQRSVQHWSNCPARTPGGGDILTLADPGDILTLV